jgi:predicted RecB family nuclease
MTSVITTEAVVALSQCPRKAHLLLDSPDQGSVHPYHAILERHAEKTRERYLIQLTQAHPEALPYNPTRLSNGKPFLTQANLQSGNLRAFADVLVRTSAPSAVRKRTYEPVLVVGTYGVTADQKLALAFTGYVLGQMSKGAPPVGVLVTRDGQSHRIRLVDHYSRVAALLGKLGSWAASTAQEPPPVVLNPHCPECPFREACTAKAEAADHLSLLDRMTPRLIARYQKKGIFTTYQLSCLFKPQRRRKSRSGTAASFNIELQALALRTGKTYVQSARTPQRAPTELFLDIEGIPDEQFYYLVGLLVCEGDNLTHHSFWANSRAEEATVWQQLQAQLDRFPSAPIYHYGSYEARAISHLGQRYGSDVACYRNRLVNVTDLIYGRVYFPVRSNSLKAIGKHLGVSWSEPQASGLQSLVWRHQWEDVGQQEYRTRLIDYNREDCQALYRLLDELARILECAGSNSRIDFAKRPGPHATQAISHVHAEFETILQFAHADCPKDRFTLGEEEGQHGEERRGPGAPVGHQGYKRLLPSKPFRIVPVPPRSECPKHPGERLVASDQTVERFVIDLRFTKAGCRKTVTKYVGRKAKCPQQGRLYSPPDIDRPGGRLFGHNFQAWNVYQRIVLRLPYRVIEVVTEELFGERASEATIINFIRYLAEYYEETEHLSLKRMLESPFLHADETRINIQGTEQYVWVFTDARHVVLRLSETREAALVREVLDGYQGVLVSDFYPAYDGVPCRQQKCWVHLIRDLNEDLCKHPFDREYEMFVVEVRNLFVPIVAAIRRYGLKRRHLGKFRAAVDRFYDRWIESRDYESEVTRTYHKRLDRYRISLFRFLEEDGIPWNNNAAERAIRHLAIQRKISGTFFKSLAPQYLLLLGIAQTCRFQEKPFLKFLLSEQLDVDAFKAGKRLQISEPVGQSRKMDLSCASSARACKLSHQAGEAHHPLEQKASCDGCQP